MALLLFAEHAGSVEPLSTPELAEHCALYYEDREGKDAIFCLGEADPLEEVVENVVDDLANRQVLDEDLLARDAVFSTLRRAYPCD